MVTIYPGRSPEYPGRFPEYPALWAVTLLRRAHRSARHSGKPCRIDAPRLPHRPPNKLLPEHLAAVERALGPADGVAALRAMPTAMLHPGHRPPAGHIPGLATERTLHALPGWRAPGRARLPTHHDRAACTMARMLASGAVAGMAQPAFRMNRQVSPNRAMSSRDLASTSAGVASATTELGSRLPIKTVESFMRSWARWTSVL